MLVQETKKSLFSSLAACFFASALLAVGEPERQVTSIEYDRPETGEIELPGLVAIDHPMNPDEKRIYMDGHHFLSVLTGNDEFAIRPRPGLDVDGWGSTLYLQAFLAGAHLGHTQTPQFNVVNVMGTDVMQITANGSVSRGLNSTYGTWSTTLNAVYDSENKKVQISGQYDIHLDGSINGLGDLNIYRIASNYLRSVPLLDGTTGDTGDVLVATYNIPGVYSGTWNPAVSSGTFPIDQGSQLIIDVSGNDYNVDTVRQGHEQIAQAYKPSMKVTLTGSDPSMEIRFGAFYNLSEQTFFWADNIGITPWIPPSEAVSDYSFTVEIESCALPQDLYSSEVTLKSEGDGDIETAYFSPDLQQEFRRVGSLDFNGSEYVGKFKVDSLSRKGFFRTGD